MNPCTVERLENRDQETLFGPGTQIILRTPDTGREYVLSYEQIDAACEGVEHIELTVADIDLTPADQPDDQVQLPSGEVAGVVPGAAVGAEAGGENDLDTAATEEPQAAHSEPDDDAVS